MRDPVAALPDFEIVTDGAASALARATGCTTFRETARQVWNLPYGRNSNRADPLLVLTEGRGTCSTKHAYLAALAREAGVPLELVLGIYMMSEANTPGVGPVLDRHSLEAIPEAHCYLRVDGERIDLTHPPDALPGEPIDTFLHEEPVEPHQVGDYKQRFHRDYMGRWLQEPGAPPLTPDDAWAIREACIAALGEAA
ncbi:MAG: transglutaminase domain-containing protein [Dehalococcoidia bacterium]|nr:transglutaminase domain-containing protein [Dehalococcoidia bacterium]